MTTDNADRGSVEGNTTEAPHAAHKQDGLHQDVEVGMEMVDIDRIEKVYK
jgi:hypothetical protein